MSHKEDKSREELERAKSIIGNIGYDAVLSLLAEEATELTHAALKLLRVLDKVNPTPVTVDEAQSHLIEEFADVITVAGFVFTNDEFDKVREIRSEKIKRWAKRMQDALNEK